MSRYAGKINLRATIFPVLIIAILLVSTVYFISRFKPQVSFQSASAEVEQGLIDNFKNFPMRGIWGGIVDDTSDGVDEPQAIIANLDKLNTSINKIYKRYKFNTVFVGFGDLKDSSSGEISNNGKRFLKRMAEEQIRVVINFYSQPFEKMSNTSFRDNYEKGVRTFIKSLDNYKKSSDQTKAHYENILAYLIGDDVNGNIHDDNTTDRCDRVLELAKFIRNTVYNNPSPESIKGKLDIPLMVDVGGISETAANDLKNDVEIIGAYDYTFLRKMSHIGTLNTFRLSLGDVGINANDRFFTILQAHNQNWYKAIFNNTDDDPYPEGIQSASLVYQSIRTNTKQYLFFNRPNFNNSGNNFAKDRLAEIGLANKLVDILWDKVLINSVPNNAVSSISDTSSVFSGNVLNFTDRNTTNGKTTKGALIVVNSNNSHNIFGNSSAKNAVFKQFVRISDKKTQNLTFADLGINNEAGLEVKIVDFTHLGQVPIDVIGNNISLTVPYINENAFILMTHDEDLINEIDKKLLNYSSTAKSLACEALESRLDKTKNEFSKIKGTGYKMPKEYENNLQTIANNYSNCANLNYRQIRDEISSIGNAQIDLYNHILERINPVNPPIGISSIGNLQIDVYNQESPDYPSGEKYIKEYWSPATTYADFITPKLQSGEPQKFNFYLLDKYLQWKKGGYK